MPPNRKKAITNEQRQALRTWFHQQNPRPSQRAAIAWFQQQYNHKLSQSTVSDSLSKRYQYLDNTKASTYAKNRTGNWAELEIMLADWHQLIVSRGGSPSGELLTAKAREIWKSLPQYSHLPEPNFSTGWLHRFKKRFGIQQRTYHSKSNSRPLQAGIEMSVLRATTTTEDYARDSLSAGHTQPNGEVHELNETMDGVMGLEREEQRQEVLSLLPPPTTDEALRAIRIVIAHAECQTNAEPGVIRFLERYERSLERQQDSEKLQRTLDRWLTR